MCHQVNFILNFRGLCMQRHMTFRDITYGHMFIQNGGRKETYVDILSEYFNDFR